jgi:hypothetical protein
VIELQCPIWQQLNTCGYLNQLELKIQFLGHTSHILSVEWLYVTSSYCTGEHSYTTLPLSQNVLLDSATGKYLCQNIRGIHQWNACTSWVIFKVILLHAILSTFMPTVIKIP